MFATNTTRSAVRFFLPKLATNFLPAAVAPGKLLKHRKTSQRKGEARRLTPKD